MKLRRKREHLNGRANGDADVLLQLQFGQELAKRYEQEHIAIELRAADVQAREARAAELVARIRELERALSKTVASERTRQVSEAAEEIQHGTDAQADQAKAEEAPEPGSVVRRPKGKRLGKQLVKHRVVTKRAVREALQLQQKTEGRLGEILVARGVISPARLLEELAHQHGVALVESDDRGIGLLPAGIALEQRAVALGVGRRAVAPGALTAVAFVDLENAQIVANTLCSPIEPRLTDAETIVRLFADAYSGRATAVPSAQPPVPAAEPESASASASTNGHGAVNGTHEPRTVTTPAEPDAQPVAEVPTTRPAPVAQVSTPQVAADEPAIAEPAQQLVPSAARPEPVTLGAAAADPVPVATATAPTPPSARPPARNWLARRRKRAAAAHRASAPVAPPRVAPTASITPPATTTPAAPDEPPAAEPDSAVVATLPTATIVIALRRATGITVAPLAEVLGRLDYPRHRLQVMAVFDPADGLTRRTLKNMPLPAWVAEVPLPRTSSAGPRELLLRGIREASGELITVVQTAGQLEADGLRAVAQGENTEHLISLDSERASSGQDLADAYLRQADAMQRGTLTPTDAPHVPEFLVFRTAELTNALGWDLAGAR